MMLSLLAGTVLPFASVSLARSFGVTGHEGEWISPFWGFVFGFGWFIAGCFARVGSPFVSRFGSLVWPLIVCFFLFILYGRLYDAEGRTRRRILLAIATSFIVILPGAWGVLFRYVPTYSEILQSIY
jgi:hypothetical protein